MTTDTSLHGINWDDKIRYSLYLPYLGTASENAFKLSVKLDPTRFLTFIEVSKLGRGPTETRPPCCIVNVNT